MAPSTSKLERPIDLDLPDNYVQQELSKEKDLQPITWDYAIRNLQWISVAVLTITPSIAIYGAFTTTLKWQTFAWCVVYYFITGLGITAGYHRLWAHRSYNASPALEYFLAAAGSGAVEGSIKWWSRGHRAHHRYTDTDLDPYDARRGFWYSHVGWMLIKPLRRPGVADVSDLSRSAVVKWQHRWYIYLIIAMGFIFPTVVAWLLWNDARGGFFFAGAARLTFVHHSTFCVNSLAHWIGETPFDDKHTPKNHFITALVTVGEGYHNFHHQFPMDFRNAIKWYQYDPTKWFIWVCGQLGLASHLKTFPDNEIKKGVLTMQLKRLRAEQETISWPSDTHDLPVVSWKSFQEQAAQRPLILVAGFVHDVSSFLNEHPGGRHLLAKYVGKDATTAFFGGVYDHSNAAHNLLSMLRVGALDGGMPHISDEKAVPPSMRLRVARNDELASPYGSSATSGDDHDSDGMLS
ncbi:delta9-fatty acid desaturase [Peniophora sp. CONT]|nr:delta9-fatty acid desaturase [Peniophora sp. CONT]